MALNPTTPVLDAARAFEKNSIGCVVVQDKGRVAGTVTDRDLAVRVVGRGLDPNTTLLEEVMTSPVATLSPADSQDDAIRLMQELNVRRIPLVEGERLAGMITLDDLLRVSAGQVKDIQSQLPRDMRELFSEATLV